MLFGKGYRFYGSEKLRLTGPAGEISVGIIEDKTTRVELDRLDAMMVAPTDLKLDVIGPKGKLKNRPIHVLQRALVLPKSLHRTWGLSADSTIALQVGSIILTNVKIQDGQYIGLHLDRTDLASSGVDLKATAALRRNLKATTLDLQASSDTAIPKRLITENDVRQARLKGKKINVQPGQLVTPAARSLGKELGVFE